VQKVYAKLFSIYQEQQKLGEEYELFLGLGFLSWRTPSGQATRRHLVEAKASLTFEARLGKFIVMPAADGAQLTAEFDMLDIEDQPHHAKQTAQEGLLSADDNPWDRSSVESVLKAIVNSLADRGQGEYHETLKQNRRRAQEKPIVEYAPALILRKRSVKGLELTLKKMKEQIESGGEIPAEFIDLCEGDIDRETNLDEYSHNNTEIDPKIYFPKPSNEAQRQIILKLQSATGVLVQGPPGTGKSHTIANLICHLLATGQRVLVTAKTPRALQVLHDKLLKEMQHLCISLLGSGINEQRSLESSVSGILNKQDRWNDNLTADKTNELESKIQKLESEKAEINYRIRSIRESETFQHNIINGMYSGTAAKIALSLKEDSEKFCWFEDNIGYDQEFALSSSEIEAIHEDLSLLKPELEAELQLVLPDPEKDVPSQDDFTHIVNKHVKAKNDFSSKQHLLDSHIARTLIKESSVDIKQILESVSELSDSVSNIEKRPMPWIKNAVFDVLAGNNIQWKDLLHVLSERMSGLKDRAKKIDGIEVTIPDDCDRKKALLDAKILKKHFNEGGKNGWWIFKSKEIRNCRYINRDICIDSRPCSSYENLELLIEILSVEDTVDYCWNLWQDKTEKGQGPTFLQVSELEELLKALTDVVSLCDLLEVSKEALSHIQGLAGEVVWHDPETINKLLNTCRAVISRNYFNAIQLKLQQYIQKIESIADLPNAHPVADEALTIIKEGNAKSYPDLLIKINDLNERSERAKKIKNFLNKLSQSSPIFVRKLSENPQESAYHLKSLENAWAWARANSWLQDFLNKDNLPNLERQLRQVDDDIKSNLAELSANLAWKFCFSRMEKKPSSRRHLMGWQQAIKKVGKGTGKHAPKYRRDAQQHLNECRDAVPAWVMPLHRVYETVQPAPGIFDVIIVDEASQCGPEALPLMYLAKRLLVVGDEQQISPEAVGVGREQIFRLRDEYLNDFEHADSFDVESSLFDNGKRRFNNRIVLREHFRCMPEIIRFSNDLSYHATPLIPLRQYPPQRLEPLRLVHVPGGYREGSNNKAINRPEAEKLVETVVQCCNDDQYDDKTMGVIILQGDAQAALIENMLLEQLGAEEMEQRKLICGKPYSFQGDERHIIFLSMVAAPNERIGPLTRPADQRRFNVAASRAQDQIWLFHTATRNDLSGLCLRRLLLEYFENPPMPFPPGIDINDLRVQAHRPNRKHGEQPKPFESWFEVDIALEIASHGFRVVPQYPVVENKRIDLVIEGTKSQLAVECDGDHWHGIENYEKDMERQRMLERCGWRFHRIRESAYYANPEKTLESLWQELEQLEIKPVSESSPKQNDVHETMHDRQQQKTIPLIPGFESAKVETPTNIQEALSMKQSQLRKLIIETLKTRPNYSCVKNALHGFILKQLHVISRGKPREEFSRKVNKVLRFMEKKSIIRIYKSKNIRLKIMSKLDCSGNVFVVYVNNN
jgi:very-short-patch-repair endonuclease